jgi:amino acid adenylation domain-containing protein
MTESSPADIPDGAIALIGMAGRFPRARTVDEFWKNIRNGIDCISHFTKEEIDPVGAMDRLENPDFVAARSILEDVDLFDASFFGILPSEADFIDPQHRLFLESCWEAVEHAGYVPQTYSGEIGVFAGCSTNTYFLRHVCRDRSFLERFTSDFQVGQYITFVGMLAESLAMRVSYKLGLRGPSMGVQTACSTSLVAICQAAQSLLNFQCDMALAGGASITFPQKRGALYQEGGMISPDGRCRAFDAKANGTVFGSGVGVVLLKRLEDAIRDGDYIHSVIRGYGINNDGSTKVGFTAPSVEGQSRVIAMALAMAGVPAESIGYLEAHGTGTPLGDPIEFAALDRTFRKTAKKSGFCVIGTAKRNVGHLDAAAGVTGLIHASNVLRHEEIPPALHYQSPNPNIKLANSPFRIDSDRQAWPRASTPRRAGVSAFGVGGTNAHVILEEAPAVKPVETLRTARLLLLSARSPDALERATTNLSEHLKGHPGVNLDEVAYTLQVGRRAFDHRRAVVCTTVDDAVRTLDGRDRVRIQTQAVPSQPASVTFMFPGQGSQYAKMGAELYRTEATFRRELDRCAEILQPILNWDLRTLLFSDAADAGETLKQTAITQPALFSIEYALAKLWMSWGVKPDAMIGHSVGEFVAACLAGVFSLEDGLTLIAARGRMMQDLPSGAMLSVRMAADDLLAILPAELSLAAGNGPQLSVVSGTHEAIDAFAKQLDGQGVVAKKLVTSHAFHSSMMDPILAPFQEHVRRIRLNPPTIPYVSCVTGTWITADEATNPEYWARHFREPVYFSKGFQFLQATPGRVYLEVGPGRVLTTLAKQHASGSTAPIAVASMPDASGVPSDPVAILNAAGTLWLNGVSLNWKDLYPKGIRRTPLPTYPFERKRYWIEAPTPAFMAAPAVTHTPTEQPEVSMPTPVVPQTPRVEKLRATLLEMFRDMSGLSLTDCNPESSFLELGFDSLFLTQVAQALTNKFSLKFTFRQLLEQYSSLAALASHLDAKLPASVFADTPAVAPSPPTPAPPSNIIAPSGIATTIANQAIPTFAPLPASSSAVESIVRDQLLAMQQLMARQLDAVRGIAPQPIAMPAQQAVPIAAVTVSTPTPAKSDLPVEAVKPTGTQEFKPFGPYKPVQRGPLGGLTDQQSKYLDGFIKRYNAKTTKSKAFTQQHRKVLADPRVVSGFRSMWKDLVYPIVTDRSKGSRLWDIDGNEYIDILNGFGPIMLGHSPDYLIEAVEKQMRNGFEIGPQTQLAGQVADLVCELTGNERATFCNTGSEAVMAAMRVARTVTGRSKIVTFAGDYHGTFDEVLVKGGRKAGVLYASPIAPGIPQEKAANIIVLDYGTPETLDYIRQHARELAAVLIEPVQGRNPSLQPKEFLQEIRKITLESETCMIFDEIVMGFRVHPGGAQAYYGIRADLCTYGKVAGGGMPIGILAGKAKYMDALDGGMWHYGDDSYPEVGVTFFAGTFVRHPLALAASHAVLTKLKTEGPKLQETLNAKVARLVAQLNQIFEERGVPTRAANCASWFYFSFPPDQIYGSLLYYHLRLKGIHILEGFPIFLSTAHTDADFDAIVKAFRESILELQSGGFLITEQTPAIPASSTASASSVESLPRELPLTESQHEVWMSARLSDEANASYNEAFTLDFRGTLNREALQESIDRLIVRHDALRNTFDPNRNLVVVLDPFSVPMTAVDLSNLPLAEQDAKLAEIIREDAELPFNLETGPLVRCQLLKKTADHHVLLFTSHHLVFDGWSMNVLLDEMSKIYASIVNGTTCELPQVMPYRRYALDLAKQQGSPEEKAREDWWVEQFKTPVSPLELPTDRPRGAVKSFAGDTARITIDAATTQRIKQFGAKNGCTLYATMLAGFQTLMHRLTGQSDIVVGIPAAAQQTVESESLVGHCVNFLPIRLSFDTEPTATAFLGQVRAALLDAYDRQNYTFGSLVRKLNLRRDPSRLPLVEVQFNLERLATGLTFPGLEVVADPCPKRFVNFDLFLNVVESNGGLVLDCDYNRDLLDRSTVERWLGHLVQLLEGMMADVKQCVSQIPILSEVERTRQLVEWNATQRDYPRESCIHDLIAEQVKRTPNAIAVVCGNERRTYAELDRDANRLANLIRSRGVVTGDRVAILLDRSVEMLSGILGILKAGASYIPLDPEFPKDRVASVFEDASPSLIVTRSEVAERLGIPTADALCLDRVGEEVVLASDVSPSTAVTSADLAYIIYTSGSTGKPKGVQISHRAAVNFLCSMIHEPGIKSDDVLLAVTTLSFDIAVLELYLPLCVGARVVIATRDDTFDGDRLAELLQSTGTTVMQATPATWRLLLEAKWKGDPKLKLLCGGEALPLDLARELCSRAGSVWNMYGPTETTVWSAVSRVDPLATVMTVGLPIANTEFYVVDARGNPVPIGVAGELLIGGDGVAVGYWKRPDLTAEKFIPDRFRPGPNRRLYKTGDLVRQRTDGTLDFLGRADNQVKIRGFRIETGDVEHALKQCPGVRECVVVARDRDDQPGVKYLAAYFVAEGSPPSPGDLRQKLSEMIPAYMVPTAFVTLSALPKTPNGKIDRNALPVPSHEGSVSSGKKIPPKTPNELTLASICAEVLKQKIVFADDNLFDLGADSLRLFQIVARAKEKGLNITPRQILAGQTVATICGSITNAEPVSTGPALTSVNRDKYRMARPSVNPPSVTWK